MEKEIQKETSKVDYQISTDTMVKVIEAGNTVTMQELKYRNNHATVKKLSGMSYEVLSTGQIGFYDNKSKSRGDNIESLRRTVKHNRQKMEANFFGERNEFMFTFTYAEKQYDINAFNQDINRFNMRFKRWCEKMGYGDVVWMIAREPHADGAYHMHMLVKFIDIDPKKGICIPNKFDYGSHKKNKKKNRRTWEQIQKAKVNAPIFDLWGHGVVSVQRLENKSSVALYLSSYLINMPIEEKNALDQTDQQKVEAIIQQGAKIENAKSDPSKKLVKGARLYFFERSKRIFTWSKNAKEPTEYFMPYGEVRRTFGVTDENMMYRSAVEVRMHRDDYEQPFVQRVVIEEFNRKMTTTHNVYLAKKSWQRNRINLYEKLKTMVGKKLLSQDKKFIDSMVWEISKEFVEWFNWHKLSDYRTNTKNQRIKRNEYELPLIKIQYDQMRQQIRDTFGLQIASCEELVV